MGYAAWQNQTGAAWRDGRLLKYGKKGSGDILVLLPTLIAGRVYGVHGEVECKTGGASQNKGQRIHMRVVRQNGGVYVVAHTPEEMASELALLGYGPRHGVI